jgi:hypothetical protein
MVQVVSAHRFAGVKGQAVGELVEELVGGVARAHDKLAHGQRLGHRRAQHLALAGVHKHLRRRRRRERGARHMSSRICLT